MANKPNNPSLWSQAKSLARQKFDVYPSAYANGWAAKWYKGKGGSWRKAEYGMEVMEDGGTNNAGFRALPLEVQDKIISEMATGGERMPPELARARFAAAGNMDQMGDYGYAYGGYIPEMMYGGYDYMANGGYTVTSSNDRKGKTHKVTGPDGTVKYFGDSNLGQHPKDPERKAAFYARHKKNLDGNPYFRAFARETWEDGGETYLPEAQEGWVQRAANANLNFWEKCGLASNANNGGGGGGPWSGGGYKSAKYKNPYEEMSDIDAYDKDERKGFKNSLPQGVDIKDWVAMNRDASRMNSLLSNPDYDKYTDSTGTLNPEYQNLATQFDPYYLYYKPAFMGKKNISATDVMNYHMNQPGGISGFKDLANRRYMPAKEDGGNTFSGNAFYGNGGFIPMYTVGGMPCYECGGMFADGGMYNKYQAGAQVSLHPSLSMDPYAEYQDEEEEEQPVGQDQQWHPEWNQDPSAESYAMDPETQYVQNMYAQEQAQPMPAMNMPAPAAALSKSSPARKNVYNPSIVDFLNSQGYASDYNTRKQMAKEIGITNYRGTADQNLQMLEAYKQSVEQQAAAVNNPDPGGAVNPGGGATAQPVYDPQTGNWVPAAVLAGSAAGAAGLGYMGYRGMRPNAQSTGSVKAAKSALTGMAKDDMVTAIKNRGFRLSTDYDDLVKAGLKPNEIMQKLKGLPFKENYYKNMTANRGKAEAAFTQRLASQNLQTFGDDLKVAKKAYNSRFKTAEPILNEIKQRGTRTADDLNRLRQAGLSQQEAMGALKGFKFSQAAPEARSFGQAVREGYASLRELPALGKAAKAAKALGKYLPFEEGGEYYMQQGGWNVGGQQIPDWLKTGVQVLDPTGISSYGDVYDAWKDPNTSAFEAGFETLAALPVVGKFGKAAKATSKLGKIMNKVDNASKYVSPVAYMDRKFAPNAAFATMMGNRAAGKNPVTGALMNMGSFSNQGRRFFTGAEAGVDAMDNMMQYSPKKANGGMVGQEMDVTPEELEMLKAQGYQFEII